MSNNSGIKGGARAAALLAAASTAVIAVALAAPANAAQAAEAGQVEEIVVTGTLVRGVAPVGTNVTSVSQAAIQRTGVMSTNQLLSTIPQVTNAFNLIPVTPSTFGRSTFRPDLRNIGAVGHASTLILVDGHNAVGAGILQTTPDIGALPPAAIERVEVQADGGSSIYGSDAVGGIMNFITRTRFDGFEAKASAGFADSYKAYTLSLIGGTSWSTGSALLTYYRRENSELLNSERDRPRQDLREFGGSDFRVRTCAPGTITANGTTYGLPNRVPGTFNLCDVTALGTLAPLEIQDAVFGAVTQQISSNLDFEIKALGSKRRTRNFAAQRTNGGAQITTANPFFRPIGTETSQTVAFSYANALGERLRNKSSLAVWQVTPQLTWRMGNDWRTKFLYDFGWSETTAFQPGVNSALETQALRGTGLTLATALNPYDVTQTNPAVLAGIANFATQSGSRQTLQTLRAIADGPVASLPGGEVRAAFGVQHQESTVNAYFNPNPVGVTAGGNYVRADRHVSAVFGQLVVPLFGPENARPGFQRLEIDFSARHDKYNDVGATTNPKIGATWEPTSGFVFRGNYGTSFVAPSLADTAGAADKSVAVLATSTPRPQDAASNRLRPEIRLQGGTPTGLDPMPAKTWSVGLDFKPQQIRGFEASLTYWSIDMEKRVGLVPVGNILLYTTPGYAPFYTINPTVEQAVAFTDGGGPLTGASSIRSLFGIGNDPYIIVDARRKNLGRLKVQGIDWSFGYRHDTTWGAVYASGAGLYQLKRDLQAIEGAVWADQLANGMPIWNGSFTAGVDYKQLTVTATMNYTPSYEVAGVAGQTRVSNFHPINLFLRYDFGADLIGTVNIDNVLNAKSSFANVANGIFTSAGFLQGTTLGRYVNVGLSKRF